jgi:hypothetical protein
VEKRTKFGEHCCCGEKTIPLILPHSTFLSLHLYLNEASGRRTNEDTLEHFPTILAVAEQFVHKIGVMDHHDRKNQPLFVVAKAVDFTSKASISEQFSKILSQHVSPNIAETLKSLFAQAVEAERRLHNVVDENTAELESGSLADEAANNSEVHSNNVPVVVAPKKTRRGGLNDLPLWNNIKNVNGLASILLLKEIFEMMPKNMSELTGGARSFCISSLKPVLGCLENHFNNDVDRFLIKWDLKSGISTFQKKCCAGKSGTDTCSI